MPHELPRYRALERLTIRARDRQPREVYAGQEFDFEGRPGAALLPLNNAARANKLRAVVAGPGPHRPVEPVRLARSVGFTGHDAAAAQTFTQEWIARQTTASSTEGKLA